MSERDNSTFRMVPPMRETIQMTLYRLVRVKEDTLTGEKGGLKLVLRTVIAIKEQKEFVLDVPKDMEREVTDAVNRFINRRIKVKSLIDDLLPISGVMFRGIILWQSMINDELMTDAYTLSIEGDEGTFPIENPISAIIFALLKERPIQIEKRLLADRPVIRRIPNEHNEMSFMDRYTDYSDQIIERHIRRGLGTQLYREGELEETFMLIGVKRLEELRELAVSIESFEWAKRITDFLDKYHPAKPDSDDSHEEKDDERGTEGEH